MKDKLVVRGAREHNLKNVTLEIPRDKIVVFTGLSGSGKSSMAFDTIFAEGQRRYIESLSSYARQFLGKFDKPDVDEIEGLSPTISIDQKSHSSNPRSTVATITEIYDYLRVLYARLGIPHCPQCGKVIRRLTNEEIVDAIVEFSKENKEGKNLIVMAPVVRGRKGEYYQLLYDLLNAGFREARIDGKLHSLRDKIELKRYARHTIELIVDRIPAAVDFSEKDNRLRLSEAVEHALKHGNDVVTVMTDREVSLSAKFTCPEDGFSFPEIEPRLFSFNSPYGACEACHGLGTEDVWSDAVCQKCDGRRLREESLNVLLGGKHIAAATGLSISEAHEFFSGLEVRPELREVAEVALREVTSRLKFLLDVGLEYLTLDRRAGTLSGGEAQRIRLASQIGSRLVGTLYILDEPTIGLHQRDNEKLIKTLHELRDLGNTVILVEHDEDAVRTSDYLVDFGPGAGVHGGNIIVTGPISEVLKQSSDSLTIQYLRGERKIQIPSARRKVGAAHDMLSVRGATVNNLRNFDADIPLRRFVAVTGVSGSGKSTFVYDVVLKALSAKLERKRSARLHLKELKGTEYVNRVVNINQSPIGRTPRSNPATYVGAWTAIRDLFASTEDARVRGYKPGRFSFNVPGGRCEHCKGYGVIAIEMHFLPTVYVPCDVCKGKRFDRETLEVKYKGKGIHDVLRMTVEESLEFFKEIPVLRDRLGVLNEVGLGYLELGQSATTLSGGEAQRVKLSRELGKGKAPVFRAGKKRAVYLLDEPTTGLHFEDVKNLLIVLQKLVERGDTVVVIEHNLDVIKVADWIIDLGPEGGDKGGEIVATGTPEAIARRKESITGSYLKKALGKRGA